MKIKIFGYKLALLFITALIFSIGGCENAKLNELSSVSELSSAVDSVNIANIPFFPSTDQTISFLNNLANSYPSVAKLELLGTSTHENENIYALKLSSNVSSEIDKPVWVFTGIIHGREHMGLRIALNLAEELASGYATDPKIKKWLDAYEIWIVPNLNPVGYKHNVRRNDSIAGVDLARNFDFYWENGDADETATDYRGPEPFSEKETQILRDLYLEQRPWFGISFHQGNNPEGGQIMYPWSSSTIDTTADKTIISQFAHKYGEWVYASRQDGGLCELVSSGGYVLEDPNGTTCGTSQSNTFCKELCWPPSYSTLGVAGQSSNWCYAAVGTMDYTVEISDRFFNMPFMHTDSAASTPEEVMVLAIATEFVKNHTDAIKNWFDDFLISTDTVPHYKATGITGHVKNVISGLPIPAKVEVVGKTHPDMNDRLADEAYGRFWRFLPKGTYTINISATGYQSYTQTVVINSEVLKELEITLTPESN